MTFAHPNGAARPARIRILGAAPPPPPPPRRSGRALLAAAVVVATCGVGITLLARPQISEAPSPQVVTGATIDVMGLVNLGARTPDARALRVLNVRQPDFASAARIAQARRPAQQAPAPAAPSVVTPPATPAPEPVASSTDPAPDTAPAGAAGPDQPPYPASPNTVLEQS